MRKKTKNFAATKPIHSFNPVVVSQLTYLHQLQDDILRANSNCRYLTFYPPIFTPTKKTPIKITHTN